MFASFSTKPTYHAHKAHLDHNVIISLCYDAHLDHNDLYNFTSYITITICLLRSQQNLHTMHTTHI